jgi:bidirectional [NiFe] hydrogenase diaphorase subunit
MKIDGVEVSATADQSILEVAGENDIHIPTLCHLDGLSVWGGCRICLVEVVGVPKLLPACATHATQDMEVITDSPRLHNYRKTVIELLFSEGNHLCAVCVSNGHCELQRLAQVMGITHIHIPYRYPDKDVDSSHDRFRMDHNRCIMCTRCVRVCDEIEGAHTIDVSGRGIDAEIIRDLNQPWGDSQTCTSCGKCVHVCPVGALVEKGTAAAEMAKRREFLPYLTTMREVHE